MLEDLKIVENLKKELKDLIGKRKHDEVFQRLKKELRQCELYNEAILVEANYRNDEQAKHLRLSDGRKFSNISEGQMWLVKRIEPNDLMPKAAPPSSYIFKLHHRYTCDRREPYRAFEKSLEKKPGEQPRCQVLYLLSGFEKLLKKKSEARPRWHFFYLYGGEKQAHDGIFQRCVNRLNGIDLDHQYSGQASGFNVYDFFVPIYSEDINELETLLPRLVFTALKVSDKVRDEMKEECLVFGLQKSPLIKTNLKTDKVCFHISITDKVWDEEKTPSLARKFIEAFCLKNLTENAPELFFFFSVQYADGNQTISGEIDQALRSAQYLSRMGVSTLNRMGELTMVTNAHIEQWFFYYKGFWQTDAERTATKVLHFGENTAPMTMNEVQKKLEDVIIEINNYAKHENRKSNSNL